MLREILQTMGFEIIVVKSLFIISIKYSGLASICNGDISLPYPPVAIKGILQNISGTELAFMFECDIIQQPGLKKKSQSERF